MRISPALLSMFLAGVFFFLSPGLVLAKTPNLFRVFILHSYEKNHVCGQPQHNGVVAALKNANFIPNSNLFLAEYFMDTKNRNHTPSLMKEQAKIAKQKILAFKPHVLVTIDDNAFCLVGLPLAKQGQKVVFCGMNRQPEYYNRYYHYLDFRESPGHNVTGVYEKLHIQESIQVIDKIIDLKKILVITDTSKTGEAVAIQLEIELKTKNKAYTLPDYEIKIIKSWEEYQKQILLINQDPKISAFYMSVTVLRDQKGNTYKANDIIKWTVANARKPAMGPNYTFVGMGFFGGASVDFRAMGKQAGYLAARILEGENPGKIPIVNANRVALVFNLQRIKELNIHIPMDILLAADEIYKKSKTY